LDQFEGSVVSDSLYALREACVLMSRLAVWRNDRIHARIRMTDTGYALYDWRTRQRLEMNFDVIENNINLAIKALVELEAHVPHLVHQLEWDAEFEELLKTIPELAEFPDYGEPGNDAPK